jgi:hypothetical protein
MRLYTDHVLYTTTYTHPPLLTMLRHQSSPGTVI